MASSTSPPADTEQAEEAVVLQGVAEPVTGRGDLARVQSVYRRKYGSEVPDPGENPVFAVRPRRVFGLIAHEPEFSSKATRWVFAG